MRMRKLTTVSVCGFSTGLVSRASVPGIDWLRAKTCAYKQTQYSQCTQTWHSPSGYSAWETDYSGHTQAAECGLRFPHRADTTSCSAKSLYILWRVNGHSSLHSTRGSTRTLAHTSWISFWFRLRKVKNSYTINCWECTQNFKLHEINHRRSKNWFCHLISWQQTCWSLNLWSSHLMTTSAKSTANFLCSIVTLGVKPNRCIALIMCWTRWCLTG